jgi:2-dehydropantoate 2-reductase
VDITIIGAGAIGGTIGAHMVRAGHGVLLVDADTDHVRAINDTGLHIEGPVEEFTVRVDAVTPDELAGRVGPGGIGAAIVAVKSLHTASAAALLPELLAPDGFVLTTQNGLTADTLSAAVGAERVVASFINVGADYLEPGRILQGNVAAFRIGELAGGPITPRVGLLADSLPYALPTDNVLGYLWGKEAYGAMLWAGAVSDLTIADSLSLPPYRDLMIAVAQEAIDQSPVQVESFDGFEPDDLPGSLDRLAAFNRRSAKARSGIYRDLMVRKRKTEVDEVHKDIQGPVFDRIVAMVHDIEEGRRTCEVANLDELADFVATRG